MASINAITYMVHHVFLSPQLPGTDDFDLSHDTMLLDTAIDVLSQSGDRITPRNLERTSDVLSTLKNMKAMHSALAGGAIEQERLADALRELTVDGGTISLHVRAQNAGVLISAVHPSRVHIEVFELSPSNEAVMATQGRLKRQFPASAVAIEMDEFRNPSFQAMLAHTLAEMSCHAAVGTRPKARKAGQLHDEDRDTNHPKLVTELLIAMLRPIGQPVVVSTIGKHTREDVVWHDSRRPWRRSPFWLLIRVTLQLMLSRPGDRLKADDNAYKTFMVLFMARVLELAKNKPVPDDMLHVMKAKIARRLLKMDPRHTHTLDAAFEMVDHVDRSLGTRWASIMAQAAPQPDLRSLKTLQFGDDISHTLPMLDEHIRLFTLDMSAPSPTSFEPKSVLIKFQATELPVLPCVDGASDTVIYMLCAFETWVETCLDSWLVNNMADAQVTAKISNLITEYHRSARSQYAGDPEALSGMLLTILELWIACDQSAVHHCGLLLDYDPAIPSEPYQSLLLPTRHQMQRLLRAEKYLHIRRRRAPHTSSGIFQAFGEEHCFSVKYFAQSADHQQLLQMIEADARRTRVDKCNELRDKQIRYGQLMDSYNDSVCEYEEVITDWESDLRENRHRKACQKCHYLNTAKAIGISIHEWPLPRERMEAQSTVFELKVPESFGWWRDTTMYVIVDVLRYEYALSAKPRSHHSLASYSGLSRFHVPFTSNQRLGLLSQTKPHGVTHRGRKTIDVTTEEDICLHNGLQFQYHDNDCGSFIGGFSTTQQICNEVTLQLPPRSRSLQDYLSRPAFMPDGPPSNTVIANQSNCPDHMTLREYKALASLGLGHRIQWQNILVQVAAPSVDFKKVETSLVVLQLIYQAGRPNDKVRRAGHDIVQRKDFASALLQSLRNAYDRIKENWESSEGLNLFISITLRILSLTPYDEVIEHCFVLLALFRTTAFEWTMRLQVKCHECDDDTQRTDFARRSIEMALICVQSFHVDDHYVARLVNQTSLASIFIQCSTIVRDGLLSVSHNASPVVTMLRRRWQTLSYRLCPLLAASIVADRSSCLDDALTKAWPAYRAGSPWRRALDTAGDWLACTSGDHDSVEIHVNLLTGLLLVGGLPLSRLPATYETAITYRSLFGHRILDVMPSSTGGVQFSAKRIHHGYELHFGMDYTTKGDDTDIRVLAIKSGNTRMLVPRRILQSDFPAHFCDDYLHWYDIASDAVEFCPIDDPWTSSKSSWWLRRCPERSSWHLTKDSTFLVSIHSRTAQALTDILHPLDDATRIHVILHPAKSMVDIDMPRLRLAFHLFQGTSKLQSRQFRGMNLDKNQDVGTLVGLKNKMVLHHPDDNSRVLVIPEGSVNCTRYAGHVRVEATRADMVRIHAYRVDNMLGRLVDNGSLPSKLFLSYLHALTSYCLPDPLTGKTGTEQALSILRSAGVRSYDRLTHNEAALLNQIARMTPTRDYYPANERVMQTVKWSQKTSFLSQHGAFHSAVQDIFDQAESAKIFYPHNTTDIPQLQHVHPDLLKRDCIRSSSFYIGGYGAEEHTTNYDVIYTGRDRDQGSSAAMRAFAIANFVFQGQHDLAFAPPAGSCSHLWEFLVKKSDTLGPMHAVSENELTFSVQILREPFELISSHWASVHYKLSRPESPLSRHALMAWLSTMAFATGADIHIVQALSSLFVLPEMAQVRAPVENRFQLCLGATMDRQKLRHIVELHFKAFRLCPESDGIGKKAPSQIRAARHEAFQKSRAQAIKCVLDGLMAQWPCSSPQIPQGNNTVQVGTYLHMQQVTNAVRSHFKALDDNRRFLAYLQQIEVNLSRHVVRPAVFASVPVSEATWNHLERPRYISVHDMLGSEPPSQLPDAVEPLKNVLVTTPSDETSTVVRLAALVDGVDAQSTSAFEKKYCSELRDSLKSLQSRESCRPSSAAANDIDEILTEYRQRCTQHVSECYSRISHALLYNPVLFPGWKSSPGPGETFLRHFSRRSPTFFLQLLRRDRYRELTRGWQKAIVHYALSLTALQQANRMVKWARSSSELIKELQNPGHSNWDPTEYPESLLLEVESDLLIRGPQEQIAKEMRSPRSGTSAVVQLNMGDGKSSVIVPIVAAALADTSRLVRIIVSKPQAKQMFQMLLSKLGGSLDRKIYHLPFSRELQLDEAMSQHIYQLCHACKSEAGVLLVQPEHLLSLKLMGLECMISGKTRVGRSLMQTQRFCDDFARDIVDESDEIFSVKFELIYGIGLQRPIELSPERWLCHQKVLDLIPEAVMRISEDFPAHVEWHRGPPGSFPRVRLLHEDAESQLTRLVAERLCATGLHGFPVAQQPPAVRRAVHKYVSSLELTPDDVAQIEGSDSDEFWTDTTRELLLLFRGLLAVGILAFAFSQKRWRVNYGLDAARSPATRLAVPYRAKDSPSMRAEFSHPDVAILLTSLSYYYGGLTDEDMFLAFDHLVKSDQADIEYQLWVKNMPNLSSCFRQLVGINLKDRVQCVTQIFPALRFAKAVVDYFLAYVVFPKEMREFPHKLTASGWDIGETRHHVTTGFSGTIDSRKTLPLSLHFEDLPEQQHTNALVLSYLLRPENAVLSLPSQSGQSDVTALLSTLSSIDRAPRVILDVGAQIVDVNNLGVAQQWLQMSTDHEAVQAVVFFNSHDELSVLDRKGQIELLQTSSFATQLDVCLVYLDEAHTRGTDLKLPDHYRAAVALGPRVTKDRLIQACMRMRKLGQGQTILFCVPDEVKIRIMDCTQGSDITSLSVSDVLHWAISETFADLRRAMPLWAVQGRRFEHQNALWNSSPKHGNKIMSPSQASQFLEEESLTLKYRYGPQVCGVREPHQDSMQGQEVDAIERRCREFEIPQWSSASLQRDQEQERELACEVEQERQIQRPPPAKPSTHDLHPDLVSFITTGVLRSTTQACQPAFEALRDTSAATYFDVSKFPQDLWVSRDFARPVQISGSGYTSDLYQRSVQWILVGGNNDDVNGGGDGACERMIVLSPYEAQELLPQIETSRHVSLHLYAPRPDLSFGTLDRLDLYSTSASHGHRAVSRQAVMLLNLFSGQVYFDSYTEYVEMCDFLGLNWKPVAAGQSDAADDLASSPDDIAKNPATFSTSPVKFLAIHMTKVRRNDETIEKTHVGKLLGGELLHVEDFGSGTGEA